MSAEDMLRDLHRQFEPLRGGWNGAPVSIHRARERVYILTINRDRREMDPRFFMAPSAAAVICKAWNAFKS